MMLLEKPKQTSDRTLKSVSKTHSELVSTIDPKQRHNTYQVYISYLSGELLSSQVTPTESYLSYRISPMNSTVMSAVDSIVETAQSTFMEPVDTRISGDGCELIIESTHIEDGVSYIPEHPANEERFLVTKSSTPELYAEIEEFIRVSEKELV